MAQYRYGGKEPVHEDDGGILRPLDVREFDQAPGEPWEPAGSVGDGPLPLDVPPGDEDAPDPGPAAKTARGKGEK